MRGASATIALEIPVSTVMKAGIGVLGRTSVWNSPMTSPPRTVTAPISVMPQSAGEPPVVSRSTTTNVTSDRGTPKSSNVSCTICMKQTYDRPPTQGPRHPDEASGPRPRSTRPGVCQTSPLAFGTSVGGPNADGGEIDELDDRLRDLPGPWSALRRLLRAGPGQGVAARPRGRAAAGARG